MVDLEAFRLPVELTEEEWVRLQQLIVADMVEETRRQPPQTEFYGFTPSSRHEADKAREAAIMRR